MRLWLVALVAGASFLAADSKAARQSAAPAPAAAKGARLSDLTWAEAEGLLRPGAVVVIPVGAAAKEHGLHLKLGNDLAMANYLAGRVLDASPVVVAPPLTYHFYPAFLEYPGSTSLNLETAKTMTLEVVRSLARYGPRRFYALNTGISTARALQQAATTLAGEGVLFGYTDLGPRLDQLSGPVRRQAGGSHADEIETSMMLYIDPSAVDMTRAVKEFSLGAATPLRLTRQRAGTAAFSASGVWGDPTLASRDKGAVVVEGLVRAVLDEIETIRMAPLPVPTPPAPARPAVAPPRPTAATPLAVSGNGCPAGVDRAIQDTATAYSAHWNNADAEKFAGLWTDGGDIVHADGVVERSRPVIYLNRTELFRRREYRGSKHPINIGNIRCITPQIAVVDGRWELRGVSDAAGKMLSPFEGQFTMVLNGGAIEAYRYTLKASSAPLPTWLKKPGWPDIPK